MDISLPHVWMQREANTCGVKSKIVEEKNPVNINSNFKRKRDQQLEAG